MEKEIRSILIIDDSFDFRRALLVRLGKVYPDAIIVEYDPVHMGRPPKEFRWEDYDVLLLDYYLGGEDTGLKWFIRCKKSPRFPATVILTGMYDEETKTKVLNSGVHHYMSKSGAH